MSLKADMKLSLGNVIWMIGVIFMAGNAYSNISHLEHEIVILENRLNKKIKIIGETEDRIINLEKELLKLKLQLESKE